MLVNLTRISCFHFTPLSNPRTLRASWLSCLDSSTATFSWLIKQLYMATANSGSVGVGLGSGGGAVFVYGSLLADDVVQLLLNRIPQTSPAFLNGYHRFSIKGRVYPAISPVENSKVTGRVLIGLSAKELDILDEYEAEEYDKKLVDVSLLDTSEVLQAYTYVWGDSADPDLYGEWDFGDFKASKLKDYVEMTKRFVEEMANGL